MSQYSDLDAFVNAVVNNNDVAAQAAMKSYAVAKMAEIRNPPVPVTEQFANYILEFDEQSPIKLNGDHVMVNGKHVGSIESDLNDFNSGIHFIPLNGGKLEVFDDIADLYAHIAKAYGVSE